MCLVFFKLLYSVVILQVGLLVFVAHVQSASDSMLSSEALDVGFLFVFFYSGGSLCGVDSCNVAAKLG